MTLDPWPLQAALYTKLTSDTALMAQLTGIHDHVPQGSVLPYLTLGDFQLQDWSTASTLGARITYTLSLFHDAQGKKQPTAAMARVQELLNHATLTVSGITVVLMRTGTLTTRNVDGRMSETTLDVTIWWHG